MSLKGRLLAIAVIFGLLAGICYIGRNSGDFTGKVQPEEIPEEQKETLYFWYSDAEMTDFFGSAAVAFGEKRGVRVIPRLVSDNQYLEAINKASLEDDHMPDVYLISNDFLGQAYLAGLAERIDDPAGLCSQVNFPQTALSAVTYMDRIVAYPYYYDTSVLLYNKTYLEDWTAAQLAALEGESGEQESGEEQIPENDTTLEITPDMIEDGIPANFDELLAFADHYDAPDNVEAVLKWDVSDILYNYYFIGAYLEIGGESGDDETLINLYNEEAKQCLEIYQALNQFFFIDADAVAYEAVLQEFIEGKLVFTVVTADALQKLEQARADGTFAYEYGVATMPKPSAQLDGRSLSVTGCVAVNGYSHRKELANEFAAFLTGDYLGELYSRTGKVAAKLSENRDNEYLMTFRKEYENAISLPKMIETSNYWLWLEVAFARIWAGEDVDTQLQALNQQILSQFE